MYIFLITGSPEPSMLDSSVCPAGAVPTVLDHIANRTEGILDDAVLLDAAEILRQRQLLA